MQATFEQYPDSALKDLTVSGVTGGSSSRLSRPDVGEVYVPLKRRMCELASSDTPQSSTVLNRSPPGNIKTVQVNMGVKLLSKASTTISAGKSTVKSAGAFGYSAILNKKCSPTRLQ